MRVRRVEQKWRKSRETSGWKAREAREARSNEVPRSATETSLNRNAYSRRDEICSCTRVLSLAFNPPVHSAFHAPLNYELSYCCYCFVIFFFFFFNNSAIVRDYDTSRIGRVCQRPPIATTSFFTAWLLFPLVPFPSFFVLPHGCRACSIFHTIREFFLPFLLS